MSGHPSRPNCTQCRLGRPLGGNVRIASHSPATGKPRAASGYPDALPRAASCLLACAFCEIGNLITRPATAALHHSVQISRHPAWCCIESTSKAFGVTICTPRWAVRVAHQRCVTQVPRRRPCPWIPFSQAVDSFGARKRNLVSREAARSGRTQCGGGSDVLGVSPVASRPPEPPANSCCLCTRL